MKNRHILVNRIKTPDGTILHSTHRHDYITHLDKNGEKYMVDGGSAYLRRNICKEPYEELSLYADDPYEEVRKVFKWGTYGVEPDYSHCVSVNIYKISNPHIEAILDTQKHLPSHIYNLFLEEKAYREEEKIFIEEVVSYE